MTGNALGFIEVIGLTAAVEAADTAVKSANVRLLGYELARGGGMTAVKVTGDVGAVKAAVKSAAAAAGKVGQVVSVHVIPRPASGTERIVLSRETVGLDKDDGKAAANGPAPAKAPRAGGARQADGADETKKPRGQPKRVTSVKASGTGREKPDLQPKEKEGEGETQTKAPPRPPDTEREEPPIDKAPTLDLDS